MHNHYVATLLAVFVMAGVTGCGSSGGGPKEYPVTGTVKFDGTPVETGQILFRATERDKRGYSGSITNGAYDLKAEAGKMTVQITASRIIPGKFDESNPGEKSPVGEMYIPARYNTQTELTAEVKPGKNSIDFDLKSETKR